MELHKAEKNKDATHKEYLATQILLIMFLFSIFEPPHP